MSPLWFLIACIPIPLFIVSVRPDLLESDKTKPDCEDALVTSTDTNNKEPNSTDSSLKKSSTISIPDYLFRTRNSALQAILAGILYGGYGTFLWYGLQFIPDSFNRQVSIITIAISMITFIFATLSQPNQISSPIHKDYIPPELKQADPNIPLSDDLRDAVKERFDETWFKRIGMYKYDNTIFFPHQWCKDCQQPKPARSQHCTLCGYCIPRADHHCWWLNTHIGEGNYNIFIFLLFTKAWLVSYGTWILNIIIQNISKQFNLDQAINDYLTTQGYLNWYDLRPLVFQLYKHQFIASKFPLLWTLYALIATLLIPIVFFFGYHIRLVLFNITTHEDTKRNYLEKWLKLTSLSSPLSSSSQSISNSSSTSISHLFLLLENQNFDAKLRDLDQEMLSLSTENERDEFWKRNPIEEFVGMRMGNDNENNIENNDQSDGNNNQRNGNNNQSNGNNNQNLGDNADDDLVGCIPGISGNAPNNKKNSNNTKQQKHSTHQEEEITGCMPMLTSNCNDCNSTTCDSGQKGDKNNQNGGKLLPKPQPRSPFPQILYPSTLPPFNPTEDQQYIAKLIQKQHRPTGYDGWYEPDDSPTILPSTVSQGQEGNETEKSTKLVPSPFTVLPLPHLWTREYYTFAVTKNIYDLGSIWLNIKDAFGLLTWKERQSEENSKNKNNKKNLQDTTKFDEYDIDQLIRLRTDWEIQMAKANGTTVSTVTTTDQIEDKKTR